MCKKSSSREIIKIEDVEIKELLNGAKLYLELYESIQKGEETKFEKWCHLASAAIRISTLHEKNGDKIKNNEMEKLCEGEYKIVKDKVEKDLLRYAYVLLRDNICHVENSKNKYREFRPRLIQDIGMEKIFGTIREDYFQLYQQEGRIVCP